MVNSIEDKTFVSLFIEFTNNMLIKDVGMVPYQMYKQGKYHSYIAGYAEENYPYIENEVKGLHIWKIKKYTGKPTIDGALFLWKNAKKIDILQLNHLSTTWNKYWIRVYKFRNRKGIVYLKLDTNYDMVEFEQKKWQIKILKKCDLVSAEIAGVAELLSKKWKRKVLYVPNGTYEKDASTCEWKQKENVICTVGRIGCYQKATDILLEGFRRFAQNNRNWTLRVIGPIEEAFVKEIEQYEKLYPDIAEQVCFVGNITDRKQLEEEYKKAKIFCLTSRWESFGIAIAEAIKKGCFIVSTKIDSFDDLTDFGKYGCSMVWEDAIHDDASLTKEKLSENIAHLLQMAAERPEDECSRICLEAQNYARKRFDWNEIMKPVIEEVALYEKKRQ